MSVTDKVRSFYWIVQIWRVGEWESDEAQTEYGGKKEVGKV